MFHSILNLLMGCRHARITFPITRPRIATIPATNRTYVVCLDCGKQFAYDFSTMQIGAALDQAEVLTPCPVEAARRAL